MSTILAIETPNRYSAHIGVMVKVGSRHENPEIAGMAHFMEHMFFNGTDKRDKKRLHIDIDRAGQTNAYTNREDTYYYIDSSKDNFAFASEILSDLMNPVFPVEEIEKEKKVVLSEINRGIDDPNITVWNKAFLNSCGKGFGSPILGSKKTVLKFNRGSLIEFFNEHYTEDNMIVVGAAAMPKRTIEAILRRDFTARFTGSPARTTAGPVKFQPKQTMHHREMQDVQMVFSWNGVNFGSKEKPCLIILNEIFGSGFSSRLNRKIREELGLAYAVGSSVHTYGDFGMLNVYVATPAKSWKTVVDHVIAEANALKDSITADEVEEAKSKYIRWRKTAFDTPSSVANYHVYRRAYDVDMPFAQWIRQFEKLRLSDIQGAAAQFLHKQKFNLTGLGPVALPLGK